MKRNGVNVLAFNKKSRLFERGGCIGLIENGACFKVFKEVLDTTGALAGCCEGVAKHWKCARHERTGSCKLALAFGDVDHFGVRERSKELLVPEQKAVKWS